MGYSADPLGKPEPSKKIVPTELRCQVLEDASGSSFGPGSSTLAAPFLGRTFPKSERRESPFHDHQKGKCEDAALLNPALFEDLFKVGLPVVLSQFPFCWFAIQHTPRRGHWANCTALAQTPDLTTCWQDRCLGKRTCSNCCWPTHSGREV